MTFGETLKRLRQRNNISQDELAKKLNVKQYVISSWEIGRSEPNIEQIKFLSTYFNVPTDYLLGKDSTQPPVILDTSGLTDAQIQAIRNLMISIRDK